MYDHHMSRFSRVGLWVLAACTSVFLAGCGGSGDAVGSSYNLTTNQAVRAASVGSHKSAATGAAFTYKLVRMASPGSSVIHSNKPFGGPVTKDSITGLYQAAAVQGADGTYTVQYYTDAAATDEAGTLTFKPPAGFPDYPTYPAVVPASVNITKGPVPCNGSATITFSGTTGANRLLGDLHLTKDKIDYHFDMNLSDALGVTGTITIKENGQEIEATNLHGPALGTIACDILIKPTNWTGTGSLKLADGKIKLTLNTEPNDSGCDFDGSGNLVIDNPDGTHATVTDPLNADLTDTSGGGGGGGGGGGTGTFQEPVRINGPTGFGIVRVLGSGQMTGYDGSGNGIYWSSTNAAPTTLKQRVTGAKVSAQGLAIVGSKVEVVGFETNGSTVKPIIWKDVTQAPTLLQVVSTGKAFGINSSGKVVGVADGKPVIWDSVNGGPAAALKTSPYNISRATHIANNGVIADLEVGIPPYTWASATADPRDQSSVTGQIFDRVTQANDMNIVTAGMAGVGTNPSGYRVGMEFKYSSGSYLVYQMNQTANVDNGGGAAFGISDTGVLVGTMSTSAGTVGVYWRDGSANDPIDINTKLPNATTWKIADIGWMLANGTMIAFGDKTGGPTNAAVFIKPSP